MKLRTRFLATIATALMLAAAPTYAEGAKTHVTVGHDLTAELSRHWTLPSGLVVSLRVTDEQDRTITGSCTGDSCMVDGPNVAADVVEIVEEGVQSVGVGLGYSRDMDGYELTAQAVATYTPERGVTGREAIPAGVSGMAEVRLTKDSYIGFVGYQIRDRYKGGFGPNVLPVFDKDAGHWRFGLGIRF